MPILIGLAALAAVGTRPLSAQEPSRSGESLFGVCVQCHGREGHGNRDIHAPGLTGLEPWYLARQLEGYRAGMRGRPDQDVHESPMVSVSRSLADTVAVSRLVEYIDSLPNYVPQPSIDGDATRGRQLYETCDSCHGAAGEGNPSFNAPGLANRDDWYLAQQLLDFVNGNRGSHAADMYGQQMVPVSRVLTSEQAVLDLVAYINTLP
jgi:cytochrome c oxidase subunit II